MQPDITNPSLELSRAIKHATWDKFTNAYRRKFRKELEPTTFVVIASVALVEPVKQTFLIVSVGEGTKSMPNCAINEENRQDLLADMHAEMLALRGFKRFLLEELRKGDSQYLQWNSKKTKHSLKKDFEVWLYCSEVFCGDCCINQKDQSFSGAKPLAFLKDEAYPNHKFMEDVLRTKPGRNDLPIPKRSAILSCSDLIGLTNILGIQGRTLFSSIIPIYLSMIIVDTPESLKQSLSKGINFQLRLHRLLKRPMPLIHRQIFHIIVQGKQRKISSQFRHSIANILIMEKEENRDREGFELCGIFTLSQEEWLNGKTGLPEGSSLKNYKQKGKISKFSQTTFKKEFDAYKVNEMTFKYDAILARVQKLFGEWIQSTFQ